MRSFLMDYYLWLKSIHLIFVIAWMAGMMYLPRLFVYHHGASEGGELENALKQMERRLMSFIINPSITLAWVFGLLMIFANEALWSAGWFHVKITAALIMSAIHGFYAGSVRKFARGDRPRTERFWRMMNEVPFGLLIIIVIMVIVRPF